MLSFSTSEESTSKINMVVRRKGGEQPSRCWNKNGRRTRVNQEYILYSVSEGKNHFYGDVLGCPRIGFFSKSRVTGFTLKIVLWAHFTITHSVLREAVKKKNCEKAVRKM